MKALIIHSGSGICNDNDNRSLQISLKHLANGETVLGRQLRILSEQGITDFLIVTGLLEDQVKEGIIASVLSHNLVRVIHNPHYNNSNIYYALSLCKEYLDEDVILILGNLVFDNGFVRAIIESPETCLVAVNRDCARNKDSIKARILGDVISELSDNRTGIDWFILQPIFKLNRYAMTSIMASLLSLIDDDKTAYLEKKDLDELLKEIILKPFSCTNHFIESIMTEDDFNTIVKKIRIFDFKHQELVNELGGILRIPSLLKKRGVSRLLLVCDNSYDKLCIKDVLAKEGFSVTRFSEISAIPDLEDVKKGITKFRQNDCNGILSVGNGSVIDIAKCIKLFSNMDQSKNYLDQDPQYNNIFHIAIPTIIGSGCEATNFAEVYYNSKSRIIEHDSIFPDAVILDYSLLRGISEKQRRMGFLEVLSNATDSILNSNSNDESISYAKDSFTTLRNNFYGFFLASNAALSEILTASYYAGLAVNLSGVSFLRVLGCNLAKTLEIERGFAVALCMPFVMRSLIDPAPKRCTKLKVSQSGIMSAKEWDQCQGKHSRWSRSSSSYGRSRYCAGRARQSPRL